MKSEASEAHFLSNFYLKVHMMIMVDGFYDVEGTVKFLVCPPYILYDVTPYSSLYIIQGIIGAVHQKLILHLAICFHKTCSNLTTFEVAILSKISNICQTVENYCERKREMFIDLVIT